MQDHAAGHEEVPKTARLLSRRESRSCKRVTLYRNGQFAWTVSWGKAMRMDDALLDRVAANPLLLQALGAVRQETAPGWSVQAETLPRWPVAPRPARRRSARRGRARRTRRVSRAGPSSDDGGPGGAGPDHQQRAQTVTEVTLRPPRRVSTNVDVSCLPEPERYAHHRGALNTAERIWTEIQQECDAVGLGTACSVANLTVAKRVGVHKRTVQHHLAKWRRWGWIEQHERVRTHRVNGRLCEMERRGHPRAWQAPNITVLCGFVTPDIPSRHLGKKGRHQRLRTAAGVGEGAAGNVRLSSCWGAGEEKVGFAVPGRGSGPPGMVAGAVTA